MELKEYKTPEMDVVDLKIQGILCASGDPNVTDPDDFEYD
jgi:hypothetical protein